MQFKRIEDNCRYSLTVSEGMLFQLICCSHDCDYFSLIPNLLTKLTEMAHPPFHVFFRIEYSDFNGQSTRGKMERWFFFNIPEISAQIQKPTKY